MEENQKLDELPPVDVKIRELERSIEDAKKRIAFLQKHRDKFLELPFVSFCGNLVDFDHLKHPDVVKVLRAFGGKWGKEPTANQTIHYTRKQELDGFDIRCYSGEPPPSCKIVEVEEHVPEMVVPAHTKKVRKMICAPAPEVHIAIAREKAGVDQQVSPSPVG